MKKLKVIGKLIGHDDSGDIDDGNIGDDDDDDDGEGENDEQCLQQWW